MCKSKYSIEFVHIDSNTKFTYDNVTHIEVFEEFVKILGFDYIWGNAMSYQIIVHNNEYDYFKVEKETEKND